ncbi:MAG: hypothetical protein OJF47_002604 [Nitrospira sp.]|nr:MAG: hypothetical protein OJF47_002604 [Nitrospira sp.]
MGRPPSEADWSSDPPCSHFMLLHPGVVNRTTAIPPITNCDRLRYFMTHAPSR